MFAVGDMHASMGDGEICGTGVEIAGEVDVRFDVLKGKQATWPVTELAGRAGSRTAPPTGDFHEALQAATEEAARAARRPVGLHDGGGVRLPLRRLRRGICQACRPSPFSAIARVAIPKLSATPAPFS